MALWDPRVEQRVAGVLLRPLTSAVAFSGGALFPESTAAELARRRRRTLLALKVIVVSVVVLQRFAVPGLTTALCAPIVLAVTAYLLAHDLLIEEPNNTGRYLIAVTLCCLSTVVSSAVFGVQPSLTSLALLLVLYVPFCFRLRAELTGLYREILEFFNRLMVVLAVVALVQWGAQIAGWQYSDPLAVLPRGLLLQTYNTFYPIYYGSSIMKANAVVFLEPSFCSQYLALALVIQLVLGRHRWRLVLYAAALATTLSGTGLLLLGFCVSVLMIRRGGRWAAQAIVVMAAVLGPLIWLTPLGKIVGPRLSETTTTNTSGNARFIAPYVQVADGLARDIPSMLFGRGPGAVSRSTGSAFFNPTGVDVNYAVVPKLAAEYGLIAAAAFIVFIGAAIAGRSRSLTIAAALALLYLVLSGSLLQPATVYTCLVLGSFFRVPPFRVPPFPAPPLGRHPPPLPPDGPPPSAERSPAPT